MKLFNFCVNTLELLMIRDCIAVFWNLEFPNTLKSLEKYIGVLGFIKYFILYYTKFAKLL